MADRRERLCLKTTFIPAIFVAFLLGVLCPPTSMAERPIRARVPAVYPEIAKKLHLDGVVKIEATVDREGKVVSVKTLSGNHLLAISAEEAVRKWKFAPGDGEDKVSVDVNFSLER